MFICMQLPSQTERPLFLASRTLWGLLCPSLLLLLCSLSRVPRAQKPWTRPFLRYVQIQLPPFTTITMNNPSSFIHYFNFFRSFFLVIKVGQSMLRKWKAEPQHLRFLHQAWLVRVCFHPCSSFTLVFSLFFVPFDVPQQLVGSLSRSLTLFFPLNFFCC